MDLSRSCPNAVIAHDAWCTVKELPKMFAFNATPIKLSPKLEFVDQVEFVKKKEFSVVKHV